MARFATSMQLLRSSLFFSESTDIVGSQERISTVCDRTVFLQAKSALSKGRRTTSSGSSAPSTPKSVKENVLTFGTGSGISSFTASQKSSFDLEKDPLSTLSMQALSDIDVLLTHLQRSLLECQWALSSADHRSFDARQSEFCPEVDKEGKQKSPRPSARQRRIHAKKRNTVTAYSSAPKPRNGNHASVRKSLESVTTVGCMRERVKRELLTAEEEVILSKKMKVGRNLKAARIKLKKVLGYEPSNELWASSVKIPLKDLQSKIMEADRARDQMFMANLRLVASVAKKYSCYGVGLTDLIQEGALGLLRGLEKFDHRRGFKLSTYVHWWIRQGVTRAIAEHSRTVRLPVHMHERLGLVNRAAACLRVEGEAVSVKSISEALNMPNAMVVGALKATKRTLSLDKGKKWDNLVPDKDSMHSYVADPQIENDPWVTVDKILLRNDINAVLAATLRKREQEIIRLHYGLDHSEGLSISLENISHRIGISRERTRQIERCALGKLSMLSRDMNLDVACPS